MAEGVLHRGGGDGRGADARQHHGRAELHEGARQRARGRLIRVDQIARLAELARAEQFEVRHTARATSGAIARGPPAPPTTTVRRSAGHARCSAQACIHA
jgi:hypothetical protein